MGLCKEAIAFRKSHPILHMEREPRDTDYLSLGFPEISLSQPQSLVFEMEPQSRSIGILYCGNTPGTARENRTALFTLHVICTESVYLCCRNRRRIKWHLAVDTADRVREGFCHDQVEVEPDEEKGFVVSPRTIVILLGK